MPGPLVVVDYGVNNLGSVYNAFDKLNYPVRLAAHPADLKGASAIILPGVGSFDRAREALMQGGFFPVLTDMVLGETPLLGICLGMQLMCEGSEESREGIPGIGAVSGSLRRVRGSVKVPHMGWNRVRPRDGYGGGLFAGMPAAPYFYFVHSYYLDPSEDPGAVLATCQYGDNEIAAVVGRGPLLGTQFHPEKSGTVGLTFLNNFARTVMHGEAGRWWA